MTLEPNVGSDRSWVWNVAADYADGEPQEELLAIRFANSESESSFRARRSRAKSFLVAARDRFSSANTQTPTSSRRPSRTRARRTSSSTRARRSRRRSPPPRRRRTPLLLRRRRTTPRTPPRRPRRRREFDGSLALTDNEQQGRRQEGRGEDRVDTLSYTLAWGCNVIQLTSAFASASGTAASYYVY